jgi:hypothetical protein
MRYTWSQARAQAAEEAQASLLLQAIASYLLPLEHIEDSPPLPTILEDVPLESIIVRDTSIEPMVAPSTPPIVRKKLRLSLCYGSDSVAGIRFLCLPANA